MPAADELYLLFLQSNDKCDELLNSWDKHFDWLEDVVYQAKHAKGQAVISKTPAPRKKAGKNASLLKVVPVTVANKENEDPSGEDIKTVDESIQTNKIKSQAAPTRATRSKARKIDEIAECEVIHATTKTQSSIISVVPVTVVNEENEVSPIENFPSNKVSSPKNKIKVQAVPTRVTRTKTRKIDESEESKVNQQTPNIQSSIISIAPVTVCYKENEVSAGETISNDNVSNPTNKIKAKDVPTRVTRTKKRILEEVAESDIYQQTAKTELSIVSVASVTLVNKESEVPSGENFATDEVSNQKNKVKVQDVPTRVTRTKKRNLEENQQIAESHVNEQVIKTQSLIVSVAPVTVGSKEIEDPSGTISIIDKVSSPANKIKVQDVPARLTRTKKRKMEENAESEVNQQATKTQSVLNLAKSKNVCNTPSPSKNNKKFASVKNVNLYKTPSPSQANRMVPFGSSYLLKGSSSNSFVSKYPKLNATSNLVQGLKIIGSSEADRSRHGSIFGSAGGPGSFLTKMQPIKSSKEDMDLRKQEELKRKQEKEEEARKKKLDNMKLKAEEQKRKNAERVRKAQEARVNRERQLNEARKCQEIEKRQREEKAREEKERLREEKEKKRLFAIQKRQEDIAKLAKQKEQEELENKQRIEAAKQEEQHRAELMLRKIERLEEQKKALEKKKEQDRILAEKMALEKQKEKERIERERLELEQIKQRELDRVACQSKELNQTYNAETDTNNRTYVKSSSPNKNCQSTYVMTPPPPKVKVVVPSTSTNYNIEDLRSDDSTDDETQPKKVIPSWAKGDELRKTLYMQEYNPPQLDSIFAPQQLLIVPNLCFIFKNKISRKSRYNKRTSSAIWNTPPVKLM